jgi:cold shock CspA family protein
MTNTKADVELDFGTVINWNGRYGWARCDRGGGPDIYLGQPELARAGIERLQRGLRLCFEVRKASHGRRPWASNIRVLSETMA